MELSHKGSKQKKEEGEDDGYAIVRMWKYILSFTEMAAMKCAIELKIANIIEGHGRPMTLAQLSATLNCSPSLLYRIMRFLVHCGIFREEIVAENLTGYAQTPLSRLLITMAPLLMLETNPVMLAACHNLSAYVKHSTTLPFEAAHGKDFWSYVAANPEHSILFNEAMACSAGETNAAILEGCGDIFDGVGCLVDVGGGNGTSLSMFLKGCPWMRGINFDLPHVVAASPEYKDLQLQHVGGDMFDFVPKADAAFLKWILHNWNDEECIKILKNCKQTIPKDTGKVIIVEAIIDEKEESEMSDVVLMFDIAMMVNTNKGKERTRDEWAHVINTAGFSHYTITSIQAVQSIIQCFP